MVALLPILLELTALDTHSQFNELNQTNGVRSSFYSRSHSNQNIVQPALRTKIFNPEFSGIRTD